VKIGGSIIKNMSQVKLGRPSLENIRSARISVCITEDQDKRFEKIAKSLYRTKASISAELITKYLIEHQLESTESN
jgi:hypothetical protein